MTPSALRALWSCAHPGQTLAGPHVCAVCAGPTDDTYHSATIMADTFTRYDVFRRPEATHVCAACAWYLDGSGKRTGEPHDPFQKMSYLITPARWLSVEREDIRHILRHYPAGPPVPLYLIFSRQKKKHLALLARPWLPGSSRLVVQFEEATIDVERGEFEQVRRLIRLLLNAGVGKTAIEARQLPHVAVRGLADPLAVLRWHQALGRWRPSPILSFALWIARTPERAERKVEINGSIPGAVPITSPRVRPGDQTAQIALPLD